MDTCFVAANPQRLNIDALRRLLEEEGLRLLLPTDAVPSSWQITPGIALPVIENASVILGILVGDHSDRNVLYELGIASALGKPIVLWVDSEAEVPSDLRNLPIIKFAPEAPESLRFALRHARQGRPAADPAETPGERERDRRIPRAQRLHEDISSWLAEVFRQEGATVVENVPGADFALWLPELEPSVGNPFVVEVKNSLETERAVESAMQQVVRYLTATGGQWGMLVYRLGPPSKGIERAHQWPMVLALREDELEEMLEGARFAEIVHRVRNERAHGYR